MRCVRLYFIVILAGLLACSEGDTSHSSTVGQGGSTSRYTIQGEHLYVVDDVSLRVFDVAENGFEQVSFQYVGTGIETVFSKPDYLYLGANDGMYIFSLADPKSPEFLFRYAHILSCDPVVVQDDRAYITLSNQNSTCGRGVNELQILDISNPKNPFLLRTYPMESPRGLAIDGAYLFVCQGPDGLTVLDVTDHDDLKIVEELKSIHPFDVIAGAGKITVTGRDGIFQYRYPGEGPLFLSALSKIPVERR